jgi:AcrR family transcriptional regulator
MKPRRQASAKDAAKIAAGPRRAVRSAAAPKAPTQRRRQSEILDAAAKVFAQRGYYGASTQDIADILGIRQASLYYYFPSKEIALERVCMKGVEGFFEAASEVASRPDSITDKIRGLIEAHLAPLQDRADYVRTFLNERHHLPPPSRRKVGKLSRAYEDVIERVLAAGISSGEVRAQEEPRALLGLCKSVAIWHGKERYRDIPAIASRYADIFLNGASAMRGSRITS